MTTTASTVPVAPPINETVPRRRTRRVAVSTVTDVTTGAIATPNSRLLNFIVTIVAVFSKYRKFFVALTYPWLLVAGNYLGGMPVTHLWYIVVVLEAGALGVGAVPNDVVVLKD